MQAEKQLSEQARVNISQARGGTSEVQNGKNSISQGRGESEGIEERIKLKAGEEPCL